MRASISRCLAAGFAAALLLIPSTGQAQVSMVFTWHQPDMQTFYLADFYNLAQESVDPNQLPDLFTVTFINTYSEPVPVALRVKLRVENLNVLSGDIEELAVLQTNYADIEPGQTPITNRDIATESHDFSVNEDLSDYDEDAAEQLEDYILQTGLMPSGTYIFDVELLDFSGAVIQTQSIVRYVSNPTRVDLVGPGDEFGSTLPVVASSTPQFFWSTDASAADITTRFLVRVVKVEGGVTAEEAMQGYAVWEAGVENQTTAIYPSSVEAIPLEPSATYAWQVKRLVETSSGTQELESQIFWFKMEDPESGAVGANVDDEVSQMIDQILDIQGVSGELEGFVPTGQVMIDGQPVDLNALRELLELVLSGQLQITSIIIR